MLLGLIATAIVFPRGWLWPLIFAVLLLNGGFGMMWGFIIKRIIAAAAPADKDRTSSLLPITQQTGFALGAALSGLIANLFGIERNARTRSKLDWKICARSPSGCLPVSCRLPALVILWCGDLLSIPVADSAAEIAD